VALADGKKLRSFEVRSGHQVERDCSAPADEWQAKALAAFPFEIVETTGANALAQWQQLKGAGRGVPVVVGDISGILEPFSADQQATRRPVQEILAAASSIRLPEGLLKMRRDENAAWLEGLRKLDPASELEDEEHEPPLGEWPAATSESLGPEVAYDIRTRIRTREPLPKVHIILVPTADPTTVPAHLHWGNWNACPAAEYHAAALRHWRDRYGAELVGLDRDTLNLRVTRKPASRDEAIELARLQYVYCNDIVDQGTNDLSTLAAELMAHDWWFFWWD
jgi:hypothetical protein